MKNVFTDLIEKINKKYGQEVLVEYEYSPDSDLHLIWHNNSALESDREFNEFIGSIIEKIILEHHIFNLSFAFNEERTLELFLEKLFEKEFFEEKVSLKLEAKSNSSFSDLFVGKIEDDYGVLAA